MESSIPSTNKTEPSHPGTESNLDSFFKRLGQGQGSRLWTGPGRVGAVPGSLRTHLNSRSDDGIRKPTLAGSGSATTSTAKAGRIPERRTVAPAADIKNETARTAAAVGAGAAAGGGKGNERKHLEKGARSGSLSSLGSSGSQGEIEGGGNTSGAGSFVGRVGGVPGSAFASDAGGASGIGCRRGSSGSNGTAFGDPEVDDDPMMSTSAPLSSTKNSAQLAQFAQSQGTVTPRKPMPKPAAKPTAKPAASTPPSPPLTSRPSYRDKRFEEILGEEIVRLDELRKISWNGVPLVHRPAVWQLLVGYMPANKSRRAAAMERKRREYREAVPQYFNVPDAARSHQEQNILRQILVDVPRTCPDVPFFHQEKVQRAMERILYIWAIRHPASGYVQGINDIMTPLYVVFLSTHVGPSVESKDVGKVDEALLDEVEADVYWCLTKLLDNIQDHYTAMQPGLQRMVLRLEELVQRIDAELHEHMMEQGMLYIQFAFRWMNCLLMRELPQRAVVRAWDTYLAEENGFESFHVYVSAALLCHFSSALREMDFQAMVMFLQDMPTKEWGEEEVEPLLSQAYILSTLFEGSPNHLGA